MPNHPFATMSPKRANPGKARLPTPETPGMSPNMQTALKRQRRRTNPMDEFDRLPPGARRWLHKAVLPWSARSVARHWAEALSRTGGDEAAAHVWLNTLERRLLARDALATGGAVSPAKAR